MLPGVDGALGFAGADDRMQLVDEEDDAAFARLHFLQHGLEAFLELAAELRAGEQRAHVEREDRLFLESLGHVAAQDALGEALDDRGLADARLADQDGVVLRLAGKDADHPPDLGVATDDRVELPLARLGDQIEAVLFQRLVGDLGVLRCHALVAPHLTQDVQDLGAVEAETGQEFVQRFRPGHVEQTEEQVLHAHILVLQFRGLVFGAGQGVVDGLGDVELRRVDTAANARQTIEFAIERQADGVGRDIELAQHALDDAALLIQQSRQQVQSVDLVVIAPAGDGLRFAQRRRGHFGQSIEVHECALLFRIHLAGIVPRRPRAGEPWWPD